MDPKKWKTWVGYLKMKQIKNPFIKLIENKIRNSGKNEEEILYFYLLSIIYNKRMQRTVQKSNYQKKLQDKHLSLSYAVFLNLTADILREMVLFSGWVNIPKGEQCDQLVILHM